MSLNQLFSPFAATSVFVYLNEKFCRAVCFLCFFPSSNTPGTPCRWNIDHKLKPFSWEKSHTGFRMGAWAVERNSEWDAGSDTAGGGGEELGGKWQVRGLVLLPPPSSSYMGCWPWLMLCSLSCPPAAWGAGRAPCVRVGCGLPLVTTPLSPACAISMCFVV